ncbi:MAG: hypothetical protein MZV70_04650 [Desulfobacterales bacterium]|nr:hypothetical protein [Desulfobacterales bacterium]
MVNAAIRFPFEKWHFCEHLGERVEFINRLQTDNPRLPARRFRKIESLLAIPAV